MAQAVLPFTLCKKSEYVSYSIGWVGFTELRDYRYCVTIGLLR